MEITSHNMKHGASDNYADLSTVDVVHVAVTGVWTMHSISLHGSNDSDHELSNSKQ